MEQTPNVHKLYAKLNTTIVREQFNLEILEKTWTFMLLYTIGSHNFGIFITQTKNDKGQELSRYIFINIMISILQQRYFI